MGGSKSKPVDETQQKDEEEAKILAEALQQKAGAPAPAAPAAAAKAPQEAPAEQPVGKIPSTVDLQRRRSSLKKTETKESTGMCASAEELAAVAKVFEELAGSGSHFHEKLAGAFGIGMAPLKENFPQNGQQFAENLFAGHYTMDPIGWPAFQLRLRMQTDIQALQMKKTETRQSGSVPKEDMERASKFYDTMKDDMEKLAEKLNISFAHLMENCPEDGQDFATKLFEGVYCVDYIEMNKNQWRLLLPGDLTKSFVAAEFRNRSERSEADVGAAVMRKMTSVRDSDTVQFAKFYDRNKGDLEVIAKESGLSLKHLKNLPPKDADDFAQNVLDGVYTVDMDGEAKANLRTALRKEMKQVHLKRRVSRTWDGKADEEEVERIVMVYNEYNGDLENLAKLLQLDSTKLGNDLPRDAKEFATKVLLGEYA